MKKIVCVLSVILLGSALYAGPVTPEKALQVARSVFASAPATKAAVNSELSIVWDGEFEQTKGALNPAFYVVTRPEGGFVMVAGDDNVQPVLGFSFENEFKVEGMPENVRAWMEQYKSYSRSVTKQTAEVKEKWAEYAETKSALSGTFSDEYLGSRTLLWDQSEPFNNAAPTVTGQSTKAVTGCVPLAIAEIMTWHWENNKSSAKAVEVESYTYTPKTGGSYTIPAHTLGTVYRWSEFKDCNTYLDFYTSYPSEMTTLGENVGQLVYDIGTILQVQYNNSKSGEGAGTGGSLMYLDRLVDLMYYNKSARVLSRGNYLSGKWFSMLLAEIALRPVYYSGMGHAYVADGFATYSGDKVIHFNLGWGGSCNGYYYYDNLNTDAGLYTGAEGLFDFYPDPSETSEPIIELSLQYIAYYDTGGITITEDSGFTRIDVDNLTNTGSAPFGGYYAVYKVNKNGVRVGDAILEVDSSSSPIPVGYSRGFYYYFPDPDPATLALGDKYALFYKKDASSEYKPVKYEVDGKVIPEAAIFPAAFIKTKASYSVGDYFEFDLTNHDYRFNTSTWRVTAPGGGVTTYPLSDYHVKLTTAGEYKIEAITDQETIVTFITVL